jgi:transcriptional antiterminator RfaH
MASDVESIWFLVRTKPHKELLADSDLHQHRVETFLPLLKTRAPVYGRPAWVCTPLFPCYLFARFAADSFFKVRNTRGVREIVSANGEPSPVHESIITELKERAVDAIVELPPERFEPNQPVKIKSGALEGWEAIFERYLSGEERVAILLRTVDAGGMRVILPAWSLSKT